MSTNEKTFWTREAPDSSVSVSFAFSVVDRLNSEVLRGFGAVPKRGLEVGGLLIGTIQRGSRTIITVLDYAAVESDYEAGPFYNLSEVDKRRFASAIAERAGSQEIVGLFRSHTRDDLIEPSANDRELADRYVATDPAVILVIKPAALEASTGALFIRHTGSQDTRALGDPFPFRRREMGGAVASPPDRAARKPREVSQSPSVVTAREPDLPPRREESQTPVAVQTLTAPTFGYSPASAATEPEEQTYRLTIATRSRKAIILTWGVFLVALLAFGFSAGWYTGALRSGAIVNQASGDAYRLGLTAQKEGDSVVLRWNRDAQVIRKATKGGVLTIAQGAETKAIPLDGVELRKGSVLYVGSGPELRFELAINLTDESRVTEICVFHDSEPLPASSR